MKNWARWATVLAAGACLIAGTGPRAAETVRPAAAAPAIAPLAAASPGSGSATTPAGVPAAAAASPGAGVDKVKALRSEGSVSAPERDADSEAFRADRDRAPLPRDFVQQPPLIPHTIRGYNITMNFNKCMDCHAWNRARETGATKVSLTHFRDRDGTELTGVSPRRYFCLQCHVPQTDARPLVENTFRPARGLR
ncbi:MAG: nitrate reductase cytochrome c-type subunit [Burkholderiaceae bacterium]